MCKLVKESTLHKKGDNPICGILLAGEQRIKKPLNIFLSNKKYFKKWNTIAFNLTSLPIALVESFLYPYLKR